MTHQHSLHYHHTDAQDNDLTLLVEFTHQPGDFGRYSVPPEDCYPATTPEVEITSIRLATASTQQSRTCPHYAGHFSSETPNSTIASALNQLGNAGFSTQLTTALEALNQGGFLGPYQHLVPIDISDLLSDDIISDIEDACFEHIAQQAELRDPT